MGNPNKFPIDLQGPDTNPPKVPKAEGFKLKHFPVEPGPDVPPEMKALAYKYRPGVKVVDGVFTYPYEK